MVQYFFKIIRKILKGIEEEGIEERKINNNRQKKKELVKKKNKKQKIFK